MTMKYEFRVTLANADVMTEGMAEALYEAGCDDGSPGSSCGVAFIDFHREAESLEAAIRSAVANVQKAGLAAKRVEIEAAEMATATSGDQAKHEA